MNTIVRRNLLEFACLSVELAFLRTARVWMVVGSVLFFLFYFYDLPSSVPLSPGWPAGAGTAGLTWSALPEGAGPGPVGTMMGPLGMAEYALLNSWKGWNPSFSVISGLFLHFLTAGLLYGLARALVPAGRVAGAAALLFLFNPATAQVAGVPERLHLMTAAPLLLASFLWFTRFIDRADKPAYFFSLGLFFTAVLLTPYAVGMLWVLILFTAYLRRLTSPKRLAKLFAGFFLPAGWVLFFWFPLTMRGYPTPGSGPSWEVTVGYLSRIFTVLPFHLYGALTEISGTDTLVFGVLLAGFLVLYLKGWEDVRFWILCFGASFLAWFPIRPQYWVPHPFPVYLSATFFSILLPLCLHKADIRLTHRFRGDMRFYAKTLLVLWGAAAILLRRDFPRP